MLFRQTGRFLVVDAPAKLNLFLEVLGKRSDGFHELETVMVPVGLHDRLAFTEDSSKEVKLCCFGAGTGPRSHAGGTAEIPSGRANLVVQAANLIRDSAGIKRGVRINLLKRIPVAAGLAGGSSDAAATLVALNRLWDLELGASQLQGFAERLGSDVAFFLKSSPAVCRGRGELVEPFRLPLRMHFVIARPKTGLSTADVFRHCQPAEHPVRAARLVDALENGRLDQAVRVFRNSLQPPAEQLNSEVKQLRKTFSKLPVLAHMMTGSGTSYFGVCTSRKQAQHVAARIRSLNIGRVFAAESRP